MVVLVHGAEAKVEKICAGSCGDVAQRSDTAETVR